MQNTILAILLICSSSLLTAQEVEYKKGLVKVDGKDYVKLEVIKQNFGLTKLFEVFSLSGEKLIIAAPATEFDADKNDNSNLYYRVTFLTANQVGIFKVASLAQEKSFAKLIGNSGIMLNDKADEAKVKEFIAAKAVTPRLLVNYTQVARDKRWPVSLKADKTIEQNAKIIGSFRPTGSQNGLDSYEFLLLSGVVIAKVSFAGGNNAQNMDVFTAKDNSQRPVPLPQKDKILLADASIDKNQFTLKRVAQWLIDNQYL